MSNQRLSSGRQYLAYTRMKRIKLKCEEHMAWYILVPFNFKQDSVSELNV